jgi:hypothetical protein
MSLSNAIKVADYVEFLNKWKWYILFLIALLRSYLNY